MIRRGGRLGRSTAGDFVMAKVASGPPAQPIIHW